VDRTTLARLEAMCGGNRELRDRLVANAARRNPAGGMSWAVSKAEYDLWRDRR
jgi:hypothetical protein